MRTVGEKKKRGENKRRDEKGSEEKVKEVRRLLWNRLE
jgi:hypothetical protein